MSALPLCHVKSTESDVLSFSRCFFSHSRREEPSHFPVGLLSSGGVVRLPQQSSNPGRPKSLLSCGARQRQQAAAAGTHTTTQHVRCGKAVCCLGEVTCVSYGCCAAALHRGTAALLRCSPPCFSRRRTFRIAPARSILSMTGWVHIDACFATVVRK